MNAKQLQLDDGIKVDAWQCSVCRLIYPGSEPGCAERCCQCGVCGKILDPKIEHARRSYCPPCQRSLWGTQAMEQLEKAIEIADYKGPVCVGDKFWATAEELLDDRGDNAPEFAHTCHVFHYSLDADDVLSNMLENTSVEDADIDSLAGVAEFRAACKAFNEANGADQKSTEYWEEDTKHKVRVRALAMA